MKITIFGSCVTRDIFDYTCNNDWVQNYFARSSVISAMSSPINIELQDITLKSNFQKQLIYFDFNKSFKYGEFINDSGYLLIDFIDERFSILELIDEQTNRCSYVTRSNEFVHGGMDMKFEFRQLSTEEKSKLWIDSCKGFLEVISPMLRQSRVILHECYFAEKYIEDGKLIEFTQIEYITTQNSIFEKYYSCFKNLAGDNLKIVCLRGDKTHISDPLHKWGKDPSHFIRDYYTKIFNLLRIK